MKCHRPEELVFQILRFSTHELQKLALESLVVPIVHPHLQTVSIGTSIFARRNTFGAGPF